MTRMNPQKSRMFRPVATTLVGVVAAGALVACNATDDGGNGNGSGGSGVSAAAKKSFDRGVAKQDIDKPELVSQADPAGTAAAERFYSEADSVVVAGPDPVAHQTAALQAVKDGVPLFIAGESGEGTDDKDIAEQIDRLGAKKVKVFGEVKDEALGKAKRDDQKIPDDAAVDKKNPFKDLDAVAEGETPNDNATHVLATPKAGLAAIATARAAGADTEVLTVGDPRATSHSMKAVAEGNTLAMGPEFGSDDDFAERLELAQNGELPGGGGLVFPGRRMVALYGHPSGPDLGALGEQSPEESVDRLKGLIAGYEKETDWPVMPAFEIIATIASGDPGPDGDFSNETDPKELEPYIDAVTEAGGYAYIDLQPGRARLIDQAKRYEDLLRRPNVGLALDPEWKIGPDEQPLDNVGHVDAEEINEVSDWLANLVREEGVPQKGLIIHQFQLQMIRNRENVRTDHPELAFVLHADGHGDPDTKFGTWDVVRKGLSPDYFMAWKNFFDEDEPMFTPEQTYGIDPRPWFVSYQ